MTNQFNVPSTIVLGGGAGKEAGVQARKLQAKKALIVTDRFWEDSGAAGEIAEVLEKEGVESAIFSDVQPDPTDTNVLDGLERFKEERCDLVVALGGGSPLDVGKVIAILAVNDLPMSQYAGYHNVPKPGVPLIAIPTTAGTGSEVTKVAVIADTERDVKMMMLDVNLLPTVALVDFEYTLTMSPDLTANVGVDTLVHAVEAFVSKKANVLTDPIALSCIRLVAENLVTAFREPENKAAREAMMTAACQGGMAFANSSVCLVHGMSRPIGALYHVPHGMSNAVLFPAVVEYSLPGALARYAIIARTMGYASAKHSDEEAGTALAEGLKELNRTLKIPSLGEAVKVDREEFDKKVEKMAKDGLASGSPGNNPVVPEVEEIVELYHRAW